MRVFFTDLTVRTMNNQFRTLIARDRTSNVNGFFLRIGSHSRSLITFPFNLPTAFRMGSHMLILTHNHPSLLNDGDTAAIRALGRVGDRVEFSTAFTNIVNNSHHIFLLGIRSKGSSVTIYHHNQEKKPAFFHLSEHRFLIASRNSMWYNVIAYRQSTSSCASVVPQDTERQLGVFLFLHHVLLWKKSSGLQPNAPSRICLVRFTFACAVLRSLILCNVDLPNSSFDATQT